jgi:hypothetical protein
MVRAPSVKKSWIVVSLAVMIPVIAALSGAYLIGSEAFHSQDAQNLQAKMEEVRSQSRLLLENVWDQIDSLKGQALSWNTTSNLTGDIKAYGEITFNPNGSAHGVKNLVENKSWTNASKDFAARVEAALRKTPSNQIAQQVRDAGVSLIGIPRNPGEGTEYVGLAFQKGARTIFIAVDPSEAFSRFSRWSTRREAGNLRGYLIGANGKVLVHSERVYSGADFSGSDVFLQALRPLFRDQRLGGVATFKAVDMRTVTTAYIRLENLPLAVVVERVVRPMGAGLMREVLVPAILLVMASLLISLFSVLAIQKYFDRSEKVPLEYALNQFAASSAQRISESRELPEMKNRLRETVVERLGEGELEFQGFVETALKNQNPAETDGKKDT